MSTIIERLARQYEPVVTEKKQKAKKWRWFFGILFILSVSTALYFDYHYKHKPVFGSSKIYAIAFILMGVGELGFLMSFHTPDPTKKVTKEQLIAELNRLFERDKDGIENALHLVLQSTPQKYYPSTIWSDMDVTIKIDEYTLTSLHIDYKTKPDLQKMDGVKSIEIWPHDDKWVVELRQTLCWGQILAAHNQFQIQLIMPE